MKNFFENIFKPINRWRYILYSLLLDVFYMLIAIKFGFYLFDAKILSNLIYAFILLYTVLNFCLILKRCFDIFEKKWHSFLFSICSIVSCSIFGAYRAYMFTQAFYNSINLTSPTNLLLLYNAICSCFLLMFLSCKKGHKINTTFKLSKFIVHTVCFFAILFVYNFINILFTAYVSPDYQMYPTLNLSDGTIVIKRNKFSTLKRGDIVAFIESDYTTPTKLLRIVGLPNENIELKKDSIYINGNLYDDKYAYYSKNLSFEGFDEKIALDSNSYLLIGDNRYYTENANIYDKKNKKWQSLSMTPNKKAFVVVKDKDIYGKLIAIRKSKNDLSKSITNLFEN